MEIMPFASGLLSVLVPLLPNLLVWSIGLLIALMSWSRHPKVSLLTTVALLGFITLSIVSSFLNLWIPMTFYRGRETRVQVVNTLVAVNVGAAVIGAVLWGILLYVIFGARSSRSSG